MGAGVRVAGAVIALGVFVQGASAQEQGATVVLPPIDVGFSRTATGIISGASSSTITAEDIARSPAQSLPDILATQAGIQVQHQSGNPIGVNDSVDLRGFGAFAQSNTLILVNGRRYQDLDLQGFDFASIPLNSIERIEITRGNSGAVLYGDGAVGGVINIVTKTQNTPGVSGKIEGAVGSYGYAEGRLSAGAVVGPWSASVYSNSATARGYRQNGETRQDNVVSNFSYRTSAFSYYLNATADRQRQNFPGTLPNLPLVFPITLADPRGATTPRDWGNKQNFNITTGFTVPVWAGADLIVDGGVRRKFQQSEFYDYFPASAGFSYDPSAGGPQNYVNTGMTTTSVTPRLDITHNLFGRPGKLLTGVDFYNTQYDSDRYAFDGGQPIHHYDIRQSSLAFYAMNRTTILPDVDISFGGRAQRTTIKAADGYSSAADSCFPFCYPSGTAQIPSLDNSEWQWAAHAGIDYRVLPSLTLFGRVARAFRVPNADERVGAGSAFSFSAPTTFDLKTQTSHDIEGGVRFNWQRLNVESSVYAMDLDNEIHYLPTTMVNVNLDPTRRLGWENSVVYGVTDTLRLRATAAYTKATFREGPYAGNDVPLVSRWSGTAGVSWDIWQKWATLDVIARMWGKRYMDNDQLNVQPTIPANATVDVRLGGAYDRFFWSATVQNLFDVNYYDYSIASASTRGYFTAYPSPGRTFVLRAGATF
ncbi:TonB-dependent receptor [Microbacteriaceae bacterium K1510]|nr:TonB-dependent receptor [Microbacteriaceae bacterium K1510]